MTTQGLLPIGRFITKPGRSLLREIFLILVIPIYILVGLWEGLKIGATEWLEDCRYIRRVSAERKDK